MKREGGLWATAALLGIAATVGVSSNKTGRPSEAIVTSRAAESPAVRSGLLAQTFEDGPCPDLEKRLQAFLLVKPEQIAGPDSCFPGITKHENSAVLQNQAKQLSFLIALLPDPLHTHFPLGFDRAAEAIQEAAQDDHYVYDSSWLPWDTDSTNYVRLDDQDKAEKRTEQQEDQPGILLFRHVLKREDPNQDHNPYAQGLVVLIVGEEPTGGIHRRQFQNAVEWIAALQPQQPPLQRDTEQTQQLPLQILGPSFSGSIPSLVELLRNTSPVLKLRGVNDLRIFSGSITSNAAARWMHHVVKEPDLLPLGIQFRSFQHSGDVALDRYCRYLSASGTDLSHLAIVSEDETAFGSEYSNARPSNSPCGPDESDDQRTSSVPGRHKQGPVHLYYPRDISALRAAYQSQSIFSSATTQPTGYTGRHVLQPDLADPEGKEHDTIRSYSGDQTALSQEAELQQMVSFMRAHGTQYVLLRSSNPLDQLFLSHFFRMTYPQGRIVIVGADLLLRRETGAGALNGVMTLTTYPLLPWEQDWTRQASNNWYNIKLHAHRAFTHDGAEGNYFATRFLLFQPTTDQAEKDITSPAAEQAAAATDGDESARLGFMPSNCIDELKLPDYAEPFWMKRAEDETCHHPPTWLSVLGNGGFWPVAVLDFRTNPGKGKTTDEMWALGEGETKLTRLQRSVSSIFHSVAFLLGFNRPEGAVGGSREKWLQMPTSMRLFMLVGMFLAAFHLLCYCRGSLTVKPAHRAHFVRPSCNSVRPLTKYDSDYLRHQQNSHRALLVSGSVLIALVPITLAWGYGEMWEGGEPLPNPWRYRAFLALTWILAAAAVCVNVWVESYLLERGDIPPKRQSLWSNTKRRIQRLGAWLKKRTIPREVWGSLVLFTLISLLLYWCLDLVLDRALNPANRISTYWRSINLTTGVSPLVPLLALIAGLYGWFWYSLQGLAFFGEDRPQLPKADSLKIFPPGHAAQNADDLLLMLSKDEAGVVLEALASPFASSTWTVASMCFAAITVTSFSVLGWPPIRNLGSTEFSIVFYFWLVLSVSIVLANAWQLSRLWLRLRLMLQFLDKLPLRRTMAALKGFSWGSVWKMSGGILDVRYKLIFRQFESLTHLRGSLLKWEQKRATLPDEPTICGVSPDPLPGFCHLIADIDNTRKERVAFASWYSIHWDDWKARQMFGLKALQQSLAESAAVMLTQVLIPTWREEHESLVLDLTGPADESDKDKDPTSVVAKLPPHVRNAEELVCLVYMGFIQNVLGRMRSLVMCMICVFISISISVASYPFDPRPLLSGIVVALFAILGTTIFVVYAQMHRDATLSNLADTPPGQLGTDFWIKLIGFGIGPVLGLITSVFPEFTQVLFSWIQPGIASLQ